MKLFSILASVGFIIAMGRSGALSSKELEAHTLRFEESGGALCMQVTLPDSLPVLVDQYIGENTLLRLRDDLAPVIGDTTKLPGHPRMALQLISAHAPPPDYAAWWPVSADSVALFWRFGIGRSVYVAAALNGDGDLSGRLFLTVGARHEGPIAFGAKHVACIMPPAA
jgi:hypothetical protein